jgi:hypothetical protein
VSADDLSVHDDDCPKRESDWMPLSNLPDEVTSLEDLDCDCRAEYDSLADL